MSSFSPLPGNLARLVEEAKCEHDHDLVDRLVRGAFEGDPLADRLAASFKAMPGGSGWEMLDEALCRGLDQVVAPPPELAELLAPTLELPAWRDLDLVDAGAHAFWRAGSVNLFLALVCGSLAYGYRSARLTRPLAATGRLETMATRRLQETSHWVVAATKPGALHPGAAGLRATVRLRMVHALVRTHLLASPEWDRATWGVPISASDTMLTAVGGFLAIPLRALKDLGVRLSPAELEAITHQWIWIASLMGTPEDLLPRSFAEVRTLIDAANMLDEGPNEDSPKLMHALLHHGAKFPIEGKLPRFAQRSTQAARARFLGAFVRRWMDEEMADSLGVPKTRLACLAPMLRQVTLVREVIRVSHLHGSDEEIVHAELERIESITGRPDAARTIEPREAARSPVVSGI